MGLKVGPNYEDRNRIKEWAATGANAQVIGQKLQIEVKGVQIFLDSLAPPELTRAQKSAATKAANKAAARAEEEQSDGDQEDEYQKELQREGQAGSH